MDFLHVLRYSHSKWRKAFLLQRPAQARLLQEVSLQVSLNILGKTKMPTSNLTNFHCQIVTQYIHNGPWRNTRLFGVKLRQLLFLPVPTPAISACDFGGREYSATVLFTLDSGDFWWKRVQGYTLTIPGQNSCLYYQNVNVQKKKGPDTSLGWSIL